MPAQHAPSGGITIRGVDYVGGQFIPSDVIDDLSDEERQKLDAAHEEGADDEEPEDSDEEEAEPEDDEEPTEDEPEDEPEEEEPEEEEDPDAKSFDTVAEAFAACNRYGETDASDAINHLVEFTQEHPDLADRGDWPSLYFDPEVLKDINETFEHEYDPTDPDSVESLEDLLQENPALEPIITPLLEKAKSNPEYQAKHDPEAYLTDNYFADDDAYTRLERVKEIAEAKEGEPDFFGSLPDNAQENIATDLIGEYDDDRTRLLSEFADTENLKPLLQRVFENSPPTKPKKFNPSRNDYVVFDMSGVSNDEDFTKAAAKYLGQTWHSADGNLVMMPSDVADELTNRVDVPYQDTSDEETIQKVWDSIGTYAVAHSDVPASAKNYGGTSGGLGSEIEHDWDADNIDVYAQFSPNWFVLRRGNHNPDVEKKGKYQFIERKKKPMTVGLPEPYWSGLTATDPGEYDTEKHETKQERVRDTTKRQVAKTKFKDAKKRLGQLKAQTAHAHNLVRSAEAHKEALSSLTEWSPSIDNAEVDALYEALTDAEDDADGIESLEPSGVEDDSNIEYGESPKEHTSNVEHAAKMMSIEAEHGERIAISETMIIARHIKKLSDHYDTIGAFAEDATNSVQHDINSGEIDPQEGAEELQHITRIASKVKTLKNRLARLKLPQ